MDAMQIATMFGLLLAWLAVLGAAMVPVLLRETVASHLSFKSMLEMRAYDHAAGTRGRAS